MSGPFSHLRVIDLSRILAAPLAAQNLADLGAEVIKVERPGSGDDTRGFGPPWMKDGEGNDTRESAYFLAGNRNKKSVTLDISRPQGQEVVRQLVKKSDVLIENYKVGNLARYGLAYEDLKKINPELIYCSVTGFGQTGPYAERPGYDFVFQGMGGMMSITGECDGEPGGGPQKVGIPIVDYLTGLYASIALTAAIAHRERTGQGQFIDMALLDTAVAVNVTQVISYFCSGKVPSAWGMPIRISCRTRYLRRWMATSFWRWPTTRSLRASAKSQAAVICARDPRFPANADRVVNRRDLIPVIRGIMAKRTKAQWMAALEACDVACGPINTIEEVFEDPQVLHRGLRVDMPHPLGAAAPVLANPIRLSASPVEYRSPPPLLGEHNDEVYRNLLGMADGQISELRSAGVI